MVQPIVEVPQAAGNDVIDAVIQQMPEIGEQPVIPHVTKEDVKRTVRRPTRLKKSAISNYYIVYLQDIDYIEP